MKLVALVLLGIILWQVIELRDEVRDMRKTHGAVLHKLNMDMAD